MRDQVRVQPGRRERGLVRAPCGLRSCCSRAGSRGSRCCRSHLARGKRSPHGVAARPRPQLRWPSDPGGFSLRPRSLRAGPPLPPRSFWAWPGLWVRDRRAGRGNLADLGPVGSAVAGRGGVAGQGPPAAPGAAVRPAKFRRARRPPWGARDPGVRRPGPARLPGDRV